MSQALPGEPTGVSTLRSIPGVKLDFTMALARRRAETEGTQVRFMVEAGSLAQRLFVSCTPGAYKAIRRAIEDGEDFHLHETWGPRSAAGTTKVRMFLDVDIVCDTEAEMRDLRARVMLELQEAQDALADGEACMVAVEADGWSEPKKKFKCSTHVYMKGWAYAHELGGIAENLRETFRSYGWTVIADNIDMAVYRGCGLRAVNQTKIGDTRPLIVMKPHEASDAWLIGSEAEMIAMPYAGDAYGEPPASLHGGTQGKRQRGEIAAYENFDLLASLAPCFQGATLAYPEWTRLCVSLVSAAGTEKLPQARELWHKISAYDERYDDNEAEAMWTRFARSGAESVNVGTYFYLAKRSNPDLYRRARAGHAELEGFTQHDIARFFRDIDGDSYRFCNGVWYRADGTTDGRWTADATPASAAILVAVSSVCVAALRHRWAPGGAGAPGSDKDRAKVIKDLNSSGWLNGVLSFLQSLLGDDGFLASLDQEPGVLGFDNGVLDLRTLDFRSIEPSDLIRRTTGYDYEPPEAVDPADAEFVRLYYEEVFSDPEVREMALTIKGSVLYGADPRQSGYFCTGTGANSKNTDDNLMQLMLGNGPTGYARTANKELIMVGKQQPGAATPQMCLEGIRYVAFDEVDEDDTLDGSRWKMLTGGGRITTRNLYGKLYTFSPSHKFFVMCNNRPRVKNMDFANIRRLETIPYTTEYREVNHPDENRRYNPRNPNHRVRQFLGFSAEELRDKRLAVLHFLLPYLRRFFENGMTITVPQVVQEYNNAYIAEQDPIGTFIREVCIKDTRVRAGGAALHRFNCEKLFGMFQLWSDDNQIKKGTFHERVVHAGFPKGRDKNCAAFHYMRVRDLENGGDVSGAPEPRFFRTSDDVPRDYNAGVQFQDPPVPHSGMEELD